MIFSFSFQVGGRRSRLNASSVGLFGRIAAAKGQSVIFGRTANDEEPDGMHPEPGATSPEQTQFRPEESDLTAGPISLVAD